MSNIDLPKVTTCQICGSEESSVVRSEEQRRRRECKICGNRWTTLEITHADYIRLTEIAKTAKHLLSLCEQI